MPRSSTGAKSFRPRPAARSPSTGALSDSLTNLLSRVASSSSMTRSPRAARSSRVFAGIGQSTKGTSSSSRSSTASTSKGSLPYQERTVIVRSMSVHDGTSKVPPSTST